MGFEAGLDACNAHFRQSKRGWWFLDVTGSTRAGPREAKPTRNAPKPGERLRQGEMRALIAEGTAAAAEAAAHAAVPPPPKRVARLPGPVRFALAVILSFALSTLGRLLVDHCSNNEIGSVAFLISVFYRIRAVTAGAYLAVDVLSAFVPFFLLRRLSGAHAAAPGIPNRDIVTDRSIQVLTSLQSALVYSVVLFLAGRFFLPSTLVLYFKGIPTVQPAADAPLLGFGNPTTQLLSLLLGLAARTFIFTPLVTTPTTAEDRKNAEFDPVTASLGETVAWNLWGYTTRTKVSLIRTAVAMLFAAVGTYLDAVLLISGVEPYGAAVYASVWVIATLVTGLSLRYVGSI
ncbi:hypothetical protein VTH06DRAFT_3819 [Thermothelomyces fergusii]